MAYVRLACVSSDLWDEEVNTERSIWVLQILLYGSDLREGANQRLAPELQEVSQTTHLLL
jgi:hypothetical protein